MESPSPGRGAEDVLEQLRQIWERATEDSISGDLDRARLLVSMAPEQDLVEAQRFYRELCWLERWLHDR